jgi:hypothetical protein
MNAKKVAWLLASSWSSPFRARTQLAVVPNVSWAMLPYEADLLACSKSGFLTEVEIKVSMSDWRADFLKYKWNAMGFPKCETIKRFYYAAPEALAKRYPEIEAIMPICAGVISVSETGIKVLKEAKTAPSHRKLRDSEIVVLCRLGAIKAWDGRHHPEFVEPLVLEPDVVTA